MSKQEAIREIQNKIGDTPPKPRYFKEGDVLKWTPNRVSEKVIERRGLLALVVESSGPDFKVYFVKNGEVEDHNAHWSSSFMLTDSAPLPEAVEIIKNKILS